MLVFSVSFAVILRRKLSKLIQLLPLFDSFGILKQWLLGLTSNFIQHLAMEVLLVWEVVFVMPVVALGSTRDLSFAIWISSTSLSVCLDVGFLFQAELVGTDLIFGQPPILLEANSFFHLRGCISFFGWGYFWCLFFQTDWVSGFFLTIFF